MTPILFYIPGTCAFGSIMALEWLGQPFKLCRIDGSELHSKAYLQINSLSQVPTLKSKEGTLAESAAILQHIGFLGIEKGLAYKQGTQEFDYLNQVMSFLTTGLHTSIGPIVHPERSADDLSAQNAVVKKAKTKTVPARLQHIEQMINKQGWLIAEKPTIADAYFYGVARKAKEFINFEKDFPKIEKLFLKLRSNHACIFAQAIEDQTEAKSLGGFKGHVKLSELM